MRKSEAEKVADMVRMQNIVLFGVLSGKWQPIETAPMETPVLISVIGGDDKRYTRIGILHDKRGWEWKGKIQIHSVVTHWMPLPKDPDMGGQNV